MQATVKETEEEKGSDPVTIICETVGILPRLPLFPVEQPVDLALLLQREDAAATTATPGGRSGDCGRQG